MLGIGVTTYNRLPALRGCLARVREMTASPYRLIVADDGSTDGTREWLADSGVEHITGPNRGVAWNKNRSLYPLIQDPRVQSFILLDDDCWPKDHAWESAWTEASDRWGHVCWTRPDLTHHALRGRGTPEEPYWTIALSGACMAQPRETLAQIGYFDSRFRGYGAEHVEWTRRFQRLLRERWRTEPGLRSPAPAMTAGVELREEFPSHFDAASCAANDALLPRISAEKAARTLYTLPWRGSHERDTFLAEQAARPSSAPRGPHP